MAGRGAWHYSVMAGTGMHDRRGRTYGEGVGCMAVEVHGILHRVKEGALGWLHGSRGAWGGAWQEGECAQDGESMTGQGAHVVRRVAAWQAGGGCMAGGVRGILP